MGARQRKVDVQISRNFVLLLPSLSFLCKTTGSVEFASLGLLPGFLLLLLLLLLHQQPLQGSTVRCYLGRQVWLQAPVQQRQRLQTSQRLRAVRAAKNRRLHAGSSSFVL
jgi:hypothetical protein